MDDYDTNVEMTLRQNLRPLSRRESDAEAARPAVRSSLQNVLEVGFERFGRWWLCVVIILFLGMLCVVIWSQWVYDSCRNDRCNQPLKLMLRLLYLIIAVHAFQREIVRHILCYSMMRDGPEEPCRVVLFRRTALLAIGLWPVVGTWMLFHLNSQCSNDLKLAVQVIVIYYAAMVFVAIVAPGCAVVATFCLISHGFLPPLRSVNAAPDNLIDSLPLVEYDPHLFDDSGNRGTYPASCAICLDTFAESEGITRVPCGARSHHAFHTECLRGWLRFASTCPLCRKSLAAPTDEDLEAGSSEVAELSAADTARD